MVIIILILFCILILYKKYYEIEIEVYELNNLYDNTEIAPRSMMTTKIKGTLEDIKNNKDTSMYLQYRTRFNRSLRIKYGDIVQNVIKTYNLPQPDETIFRLNSTPQRILAHFDAVDRYLIMVRGYKDILLFRLDEYTLDEQIAFLHHVKNYKMKDLKRELTHRKIACTQKRIVPGDVLHLTPGLYHYIENNEINKYTILLNIDYDIDSHYNDNWNIMWANGIWLKDIHH